MADVLVNGLNQLWNTVKHPTANPLIHQLPEETFREIKPGTTGGDEMHVNPTMVCQPPLDLGMLVRGIVVGDQVQWLVRGDLAIRKLPCQGDTSKGEFLA